MGPGVQKGRISRLDPREHRLVRDNRIADVSFRFGAVLEGPGHQVSTVVVAAADHGRVGEIWRSLRAATLMLERTGSTRPLSLVLVARKPPVEEVTRLEELCRVLVASPDDGKPQLRQRLAALLPLELPEAIELPTTSPRQLEEKLVDSRSDPQRSRWSATLLKAAADGEEAVKNRFLELLDKEIEAAPKTGEEP